jgi:ketosteroid isomerase-like protein
MFPRQLVGKAAIYERWKATPDRFDNLAFPIRETWTDRDTVIARVDSESILTGGKSYLNNYVCIFKFNSAGKIKEYWEYFDPIVAGVDFGLAEVTYLETGEAQDLVDAHSTNSTPWQGATSHL